MSPVQAVLISPRLGTVGPLSRACPNARCQAGIACRDRFDPAARCPAVRNEFFSGKRGSKPARRNDELPMRIDPTRRTMASSRPTSCRVGHRARARSAHPSRRTRQHRPVEWFPATISSPIDAVGGRHTNECRADAGPTMASRNRYRPPIANITGAPPSTSIEVVSLSPKRSRLCHSDVKSSPADGSRQAHKMCLFRFSATRIRSSSSNAPVAQQEATTASHLALACSSLSSHRSPPVEGPLRD